MHAGVKSALSVPAPPRERSRRTTRPGRARSSMTYGPNAGWHRCRKGVSRPRSAAVVAGNDAPIDERAAARGRIEKEGGDAHACVRSV